LGNGQILAIVGHDGPQDARFRFSCPVQSFCISLRNPAGCCRSILWHAKARSRGCSGTSPIKGPCWVRRRILSVSGNARYSCSLRNRAVYKGSGEPASFIILFDRERARLSLHSAPSRLSIAAVHEPVVGIIAALRGRLESPPIFAIRKANGSAVQMRTPMVCWDSTFRRAPNCRRPRKLISTRMAVRWRRDWPQASGPCLEQ